MRGKGKTLKEGSPVGHYLSRILPLLAQSSLPGKQIGCSNKSISWVAICVGVCFMMIQPVALHGTTTVTYIGGQWRYNDSENLDGTNWMQPSYDDSGWSQGASDFYWDDNPLVYAPRTALNPGRSTYYFRTTFFGPGPHTNMVITLDMALDDGAVIYLNGNEIRRVRTPAAPEVVTYSTRAIGIPGTTGDAITTESINLSGTDLDGLIDGENSLAVEVHQFESPPEDAVWGAAVTYRFTNSSPAIIRQPVDTTVTEGAYISLSAIVDGDPYVSRQWYKDGQALAGATYSSYNQFWIDSSSAGDYTMVATNIYGAVTSRVARVTVEPDQSPPTLLRGRGLLDLTNVVLSFDDWIAPDSVTNLADFDIFATGDPATHLAITSANLTYQNTIVLTTTARTEGRQYSVRVTNIKDASVAGNIAVAPQTVAMEYEVELLSLTGDHPWSYFAEGRLPSTNWVDVNYDDSAWSAGSTPFHGGSPPPPDVFVPSTPLPLLAPGTSEPVKTYYFRTHFDLPGGLLPYSLQYRSLYDDAVILYLNSVLVTSRNIGMNAPTPELPVDYNWPAAVNVGTAQLDPDMNYAPYLVYPQVTVSDSGNILAAEVHQHPAGYDDATFAVQLVGVVTNFYARPSLAMPVTITEGVGLISGGGHVFLNETSLTDTTLGLSSSMPSVVEVPDTVVIPAGQLGAAFDLVVADDAQITGPRTLTFTVQSTDGSRGTAKVTVLDDETNSIGLAVPATVNESQTNAAIAVRFTKPAVQDVVVQLSSSVPQTISVPARVVMPAGATNVELVANVIDNFWLDGERSVTISAEVAGWGTAQSAIAVSDDEQRILSLQLLPPVVEGRSATGMVSVGGLSVSDLAVALTSDAPTRLPVPASIIIAQGHSNATFVLNPPDDLDPEPSLSVNLSAAATGFGSTNTVVDLLDDDPDHFSFSYIYSPQRTDQAFPISVQARDSNDQVVTNFNSSITLEAAGLGGASIVANPVTIPFAGGLLFTQAKVLNADRLVQLSTPRAPGRSNPFNVEAPAWRTTLLQTTDLAWDENSRTLFATVPANGGAYANNLVAIDPYTGSVTNSYAVAPDPGQIELSPDGSFLYLAVSNRLALQRFDLNTRTAGSAFGCGTNQFGAYAVNDFDVVADAGDAIVMHVSDGAGNDRGIWRFDSGAGTELQQYYLQPFSPLWLEAAPSGSTIYGYQNNNAFPLTRSLAQNGAAVAVTNGLFNSGYWGGTMVLRDGLLLNGYGLAVAADTFQVRANYLNVIESPSWSGLPETDPNLIRTFYLTGRVQAGSGSYKIKAYHRDNGTFLSELVLPALNGGPGRFLRWSTNGLVFNASGQLWFVQSQTLQPTLPNVALRVTQALNPLPAVIGRDLTLSLNLTNCGTSIATLISVTNPVPTGTTFSLPVATTGDATLTDKGLVWRLDRLDPGATATVTMTARFAAAGSITNTATVLAYENDSNFSDNVSTAIYPVELPPEGDGVFLVANTDVRDLIYNAVTDRLVLGVVNDLVPFDPYSGKFGSRFGASGGVLRMATSADGATAYLANDNGYIRHFRLSDLGILQEFAVGTETVNGTTYRLYPTDIAELPGTPGSLAVVRRRKQTLQADDWGAGLAIYDGEVMRPDWVEYGGDWRVELDPTSGELWGLNRLYSVTISTFLLNRYQVTPTGLSLLEAYPALNRLTGDEIEFSGDQLVSSAGRRIGISPFGVTAVYGDGNGRLVVAEPGQNRIWLLTSEASNSWHLRLIDRDTGVERAALAVPGVQGTPAHLILWGTNGLAFHTDQKQLFIIRTSLRRSTTTADVALMWNLPEMSVPTNSESSIQITVTNRGPAIATGITVESAIGDPFAVLDSSCTDGSCGITPGQADWSLDTLAPGESRQWNLTVRATTNGTARLTANVRTTSGDDEPANDSLLGFIQSGVPAADRHAIIELAGTDLAWSAARGELIVATTNNSPSPGALLALNPELLTIDRVTAMPGTAGSMTISADGSRLHAVSGPGYSTYSLPGLDFVRLVAGNTDGGSSQLLAITAKPDAPDEVIFSRADQFVFVADAGVLLPASSDFAPHQMVFGPDADKVFGIRIGYWGGVANFTRHTISAEGITLAGTFDPFDWSAMNVSIEWAGDRMFTSSGEVIDPEREVLLAHVPGISDQSPVVFDERSGTVIYLVRDAEETSLRSFDASTLLPLGRELIADVNGQPSKLTRWGEDGLAFFTDDQQLHILRTDLLPKGTAVDLAIEGLPPGANAQVGQPVAVALTVTNRSTTPAVRTRVGVTLSAAVPINVTGAAGFTNVGSGQFLIDLADLAGGSGQTIQLHFVPATPGQIELRASVLAAVPEIQRFDNSVTFQLPVAFPIPADGQVALPLAATDLVWDPFNDRLIVGGAPDRLSLVNPFESLVADEWPVPKPAGRLSLSDDGSVLYASGATTPDVMRVETSGGTLRADIAIDGLDSITDIKAIPNETGSFIVGGPSGYQNGGVLVYDDTTSRMYRVVDNAGPAFLTFSDDPSRAFALRRHGASSPYLQTLQISSNGVEGVQPWGDLPYGISPFAFAGGLLFAGSGQIIRPESVSVTACFPEISSDAVVFPELDLGRVYFVTSADSGWELRAYDPLTQGMIGSQVITNVVGEPTRLVRWGADGLAFGTSSNQLFLLRSALVPSGNVTDLAVDVGSSVSEVSLGGEVTFRLSVTNQGLAGAAGVVLLARIPTNTTLVAWSTGAGTIESTNDCFRVRWPQLDPGTGRDVDLTLRVDQPGWVSCLPTVSSSNLDSNNANNRAESVVPVAVRLAPNHPLDLGIGVVDIAYDPNSDRIFAALTNHTEIVSGDIGVINPANGVIESVFDAGGQVSRIVVSDDGAKLFAIGGNGSRLVRVRLADQVIESSVTFETSQFGPDSQAIDVVPVPGHSDSVVVVLKTRGTSAGSAAAYLYANGVEQPLGAGFANTLVFYSATQVLAYGYNMVPSQTTRLALQSNGFVLQGEAGYLVDGSMAAAGGFVYTAGGKVIDPDSFSVIRKLETGAGIFETAGSAVAVNAGAGRVAFGLGAANEARLQIVDTLGLNVWSNVPLKGFNGEATRLLFCGRNRLALVSSGSQLYLMQSSVIGSGPAGSLAVGLKLPAAHMRADEVFAVDFSITNQGPSTASSARVIQALPPGTRVVSTTATGPTILLPDSNILLWDVFGLGCGQVATNRVFLTAPTAGWHTLKTVLRSSVQDAKPADDVRSALWQIDGAASAPAVQRFDFPAADLIWEPVSQRLLLSVPQNVTGFSNTVVTMDPATGVLEDDPVIAGTNPRRLAVTDDGQFLYVAVESPSSVVKVRLSDHAVVRTDLVVSGYRVAQLRAAPGQNDLVAVLQEDFSEYDEGTPEGLAMMRTNVSFYSATAGSTRSMSTMVMDPNGQRLLGYSDPWFGGIHLVNYWESSFDQVDLVTGKLSGHLHLELAGGRLVSSTGVVLDPDSLNIVTNLPVVSDYYGRVALDPDANLMSFLMPDGGGWYLRQYDWNDFSKVREFRIPNLHGNPRNLQPWGGGNVAFTTSSNELFLVRPAEAVADVGVTLLSAPAEVIAHQTNFVSVVVTNNLDSVAEDVILTNQMTPQGYLLSVDTPPELAGDLSGGSATLRLGDIPAHGHLELGISFMTSAAFDVVETNAFRVMPALPDSRLNDNLATAYFLSLADTDLDGMPGTWERNHGLDPWSANDRLLDLDGDGLVNFDEFLAGTLPNDATSALRVLAVAPAVGHLTTRFSSVPGRKYAIEWRASFGSSGWQTLLNTVIATASETQIDVPVAQSADRAFVRIRLVP